MLITAQRIDSLFVTPYFYFAEDIDSVPQTFPSGHEPQNTAVSVIVRANRSNREIVDMIFLLRHIQEECSEQNIGLLAAFADFTKAFDTASHEGL